MLWQDAVIAVGQFALTLALIPAIRDTSKPPLRTSLTTALILYVFAATFATLGLWLAVISSVLAGAAWTVLAAQKRRGFCI